MKTCDGIDKTVMNMFEDGGAPFLFNRPLSDKFLSMTYENRLALVLAKLSAIFLSIHKKFDMRRMSIINEF